LLAYEQYRDQDTQKLCQPAQEEAEVVTGGGEDGIDAVALTALEIVAVHAVFGFEMADDRLDCGSAFHLAAGGSGDAPHLVADPDPELVRMVVAALALVDMNTTGLDAGQSLQIGDDGTEGVAVPRVRPPAGPRTGSGIAVQRLCMQHELAAPGRRGGRCDGDLAAELVGAAGLALTDAFDLGRVQRIDLGATLAVILQEHLAGEIEQRAETRLESIVAVDLAADVADDAAETGAQELELAPGALELMGVA
jgi:hypothetical protein